MKILFLSMGYPSNKNPSRIVFLQRLVNELVDQGHTCHVISPVKLPIDKNTVIGKEIQRSPLGQSVTVYFPGYACFWLTARRENDPFKKLSVKNYISAVQRTIKKYKLDFDVVYSHFLGISAECAIKVAETYHKPCFAAAGESVFSYFDAPDGAHVYKYLNKLTGIISVSTENKQLLLARGILTDEKIKVYPNGIDASVFYPRNKTKAREAFGFNSEDFIVAFTGQFIDRKGVLRLEQACKELPVKVAYAGSGPQIPSASNTIWKKSIKPEEMPLFLSAADIFCLPTLNEGCCNAIIEALACGLPVVSSDRLFNDDILDNKCSIRIDCADVEQIRNAISKLLNDKNMIEQMSVCALNRGKMLTLNERASNIVKWIEQLK